MQVTEGQLWVSGQKIVYVGLDEEIETIYEKSGLQTILWDREIDCEGNLLMPGFKDAHAHSAMVLFRRSRMMSHCRAGWKNGSSR